jgi:hypothetical protein
MSGVQAQVLTIVDSQGFEAPDYDPGFAGMGIPVTGQLEGQPVGDPWLRTKSGGAGVGIVTDTFASTGSQSVEITRAPNSDDRWAVPVSGWPDTSGLYGDVICISWDMMVRQSGDPVLEDPMDTAFGPFFGVEAYDDDANPVSLFASIGVDALTGEILYIGDGETDANGDGVDALDVDAEVLLPTYSTATFDVWHSFQIALDFATHEYRAYFNGSPLISGKFVDDDKVVGGLNEFTDADIAALAAAGNAAAQSAMGTAYFDNFVVEQGIGCEVPEPASMALAGCVLLAGLAARRNRSL